MTQRDNILQELKELQSSLADTDIQSAYHVPVGYFENLADEVLNRIRALSTADVAEELNHLSPLLAGISRKMPYSVPSGFFDGLTEKIIENAKNEHTSPSEELKGLSPLLGGLRKEMPYNVPKGYFEQLNTIAHTQEPKTAKVVSIARSNWVRYAAAAVVISFVAVGGFLLFNKNANIDPKTQSTEWVMKNTRKISTDELNKFVQLTDQESRDVAVADPKAQVTDKNDIQEMIKDIPDKDIKNFLDETQSAEPDNNDDDVLMN